MYVNRMEFWGRIVACIASVSVRFTSKERGTRVKDRAKSGARKRSGRRWGGKETFLPPSPPPSFIFWLSFHFSRGQNRSLSLLRNQTETLATQASRIADISCGEERGDTAVLAAYANQCAGPCCFARQFKCLCYVARSPSNLIGS